MQDVENQIFKNYWLRKRLLDGEVPHFTVTKWYRSEKLCEIEQIYFDKIKNCKSVLDVGAGDLRLKKKIESAGYRGEYQSQDISSEYSHTYRLLAEINRKYEAILCLDVIEHLSLHDGLTLIQKMKSLLTENGVLIVQTPNARCVRNPMASDMTHLHCYNLPDLWAYFTAEGFQATGFRVVFSEKYLGLRTLKTMFARYFITRIIGSDYADNIAIIGHLNNSQIG